MPTYDYECDACRHRFEELQSINAKALRRCPKCGKNRLRRLIGGGAGLIFKGSGFYATDYRSKSESKSEPKSEGKPDAPKEKTGDAKAAPKDSASDKSCGSCGKTGPEVCS